MSWENYVIKLYWSYQDDAIHVGTGQLLQCNHEYFSLEKALQCQFSVFLQVLLFLSGCLCIVY